MVKGCTTVRPQRVSPCMIACHHAQTVASFVFLERVFHERLLHGRLSRASFMGVFMGVFTGVFHRRWADVKLMARCAIPTVCCSKGSPRRACVSAAEPILHGDTGFILKKRALVCVGRVGLPLVGSEFGAGSGAGWAVADTW